MTELDRKNLTMLLDEKKSKRSKFYEEILTLKAFTSNYMKRISVTYFGTDYDFFDCRIKRNDKVFSLIKDNKIYDFMLASAEKLELKDKLLLNSFDKKRDNKFVLKILDLASSKYFDNSKVVVASSKDCELTFFLEFTRNNQQMIFDYINNVVMKKDEYYELFDVRVINEVLKDEINIIYKFWKDYDMSLYYLLFFSKKIFTDIEKSFPLALDDIYQETINNNDVFISKAI